MAVIARTGTVLGEVVLLPGTTIAQVRAMIRDELGVGVGFTLQKGGVPLPRTLDAKLANLFVTPGVDEAFTITIEK